jgi:hypothetical protein
MVERTRILSLASQIRMEVVLGYVSLGGRIFVPKARSAAICGLCESVGMV